MSIDHAPPRDVYTISDYDKNFVLRTGFFPVTTFPVLEEIRERHEELIEQCSRKSADARALNEKFEREDKAKQAALDEAYQSNRAEPADVEVTPDAERDAQRDEAAAHARAAGRALIAFTEEALAKLRGPVPHGWQPYLEVHTLKTPPEGEAAKLLAEIAGEESDLRNAMTEAQRVLATVGEKLRALVPLKMWIAKTGNGAQGQFSPGSDLPVPAEYTPGTKPRDLTVPGWWSDTPADEGRDLPSEELPDEAQGTAFDTSDPFYDTLEKN